MLRPVTNYNILQTKEEYNWYVAKRDQNRVKIEPNCVKLYNDVYKNNNMRKEKKNEVFANIND